MDDKKEKKVRRTISIRPELDSALLLAAWEHRTSMSRTIENILMGAEEIKNIYLPKVIEYSKDEEEIELTAASPRFLREKLRKEEPEKEERLGLLKVGDPLKYGPLRYPLPPPPQIQNEIKEKNKEKEK